MGEKQFEDCFGRQLMRQSPLKYWLRTKEATTLRATESIPTNCSLSTSSSGTLPVGCLEVQPTRKENHQALAKLSIDSYLNRTLETTAVRVSSRISKRRRYAPESIKSGCYTLVPLKMASRFRTPHHLRHHRRPSQICPCLSRRQYWEPPFQLGMSLR